MTIKELYSLYSAHPIITTDSRNIVEDSLFFALKGERFNGNLFAKSALEEGCAYAIVDEEKKETSNDKRIILVKNVLKTLQELAKYHREQLGLPVIGITGTNGKTTTKELIASILDTQYNVLYTNGNLNNAIGVPLTLLRLNKQHDIAIIEMGASHPGDIKELVEIATPDYGIITNVGLAHLQGFGSLEGVIRTKSELFDYLRTNRKEATVFIDQDNTALTSRTQGLTPYYYGTKETASIQGDLLACTPFLTFNWKEKQGERHTIQTQLIGTYNLQNALAAISIGRFFNITIENIQQALTNYIPNNNRSQLVKTNHNQLIVDAYNANPTSMQAALANFKAIAAEKKMVILGAMKELGECSIKEHKELIKTLQELSETEIILVGKEFALEGNLFKTFSTTEEVRIWLEKNYLQDYLILLKGSNSMNLSQLTALL